MIEMKWTPTCGVAGHKVSFLRFDDGSMHEDLAQVTESRNESVNCVVAQVIPRWCPTQHPDMESAKCAAEERLREMCDKILAGLEGMREEQAK